MTDLNDQFSDRLTQTGIMTSEELTRLQQACGNQSPTPEELAFELVKQRRITEYQAAVLCGEAKDSRLTIGDYIIMDKIGEGGMGIVFKATNSDRLSTVAIKVLSLNMLNDDSAIRRFRREVEAASKLKHENVVGAIDSGEDEG